MWQLIAICLYDRAMKQATSNAPVPTYTLDYPPGEPWIGHAPPAEMVETEWLLTNGIGSYAMGTVAGTNTRRYHSLLVAATHPPVGRINTLAAVNESLRFGGALYELAAHEFAADGHTMFVPKGWQYLRKFEKDLSARWTYVVGPITITKELRIAWHRNLAQLVYRLEPAIGAGESHDMVPDELTLSIRPLLAMRDFHHQRRAAWGGGSFGLVIDGSTVQVVTPGLPVLHMHADAGKFIENPDWWYNFHRRIEARRHQDDIEDLYTPGWFEHTFKNIGKSVSEIRFTFGVEPIDPKLFEGEDARIPHLKKMIKHVRKQVNNERVCDGLVVAGDDFVVEREVDGEPMMTILAGYPWFADWGRDTMISLPGLLLATGRFDEAKKTLLAYARHIRKGLIPNRFDDYGGEPHYNTVDASLWFIHAALEYVRQSEDKTTWKKSLTSACAQIIEAYQRGTDGPIAMDRDGLINAGDPHTQLTWMDAKRDGVVFTPRHGKAVEINALWYRALMGMGEQTGESRYLKLAEKVKRSFNRVFWRDELGYLMDHVNIWGSDRSLRPNQIFAVSLPHSPLSQKRQKQVMEVVRERLLTPMGLRTLPREDVNYHGRYDGSMFDRDRAYHQGTVWAWPIGGYIEGYLRAHKFSKPALAHAREALAPLLEELGKHSLGQIHEVFEADAPHRPEGCMAQAWSVAETLRAAILIESA
ncbi:MAG: glycogen debranching protein [Planctomycetes bacterium]|nr:glycogen debranching protein [Planctomycetota bacterium]